MPLIFFRSPEGSESPSSKRPSCTKCFTFFFLSEDDNVEILSVDVSRNLHSASSFQGKCLSYGSVIQLSRLCRCFKTKV